MPYPFLSDEWIVEAHALREELAGVTPSLPAQAAVRMNLVVTEIPFDEESLQAHLDTSSGELLIDKGHLESADLTVTVDYTTAKAILVDGNPQAAMQAFMAGKIRVDGDLTKLMAIQTTPPGETAHELAERLRAITE
jgi:putative sterol carrier protein